MYSTKISFKKFIRMYIGTSQQTVLDKKNYKINIVQQGHSMKNKKTQGGIGEAKTRYYTHSRQIIQ